MGKFNEELAKTGVLLASERLQASSKGARVKFSGGKRTVIDGPFAETKELAFGCGSVDHGNRSVLLDEESTAKRRYLREP